MTDINDLVQELWKSSSDGVVGIPQAFFEMRRLFEILQNCFDNLKVCLFFFFLSLLLFLRLPLTWLIK